MSGLEPDDIFDGDPFDPDVVRAAEDKVYEKAGEADDGLKAYLRERQRAYKTVFKDSPEVRFVLQDLALFCRAYETRYHPEDKKQHMLEGRAETFYRIITNARLDNDTLFLLITDAKAKMEQR